MASPSTISQSISTLKSKGYSDAEIQAIQFSVPAGDNRRATALFNAANSYPEKKSPAPPPPAPKPIKPAPPPQRLGEGDSDNLRIKKRSKRQNRLQSRGTGSLRIDPSTGPSVSGAGAAKSGGVNL